MSAVHEGGNMEDGFLKELQQQRKKTIEKLERDLALMEAQQKAFEGEDLKNEKAEVLRDGINGTKNSLDFLRTAYERQLPVQPWEQGGKK
jgi:hypothetical protein